MLGRVAVTGGSGRIGRYVARELRRHAEVVNVDLRVGELVQEWVACDVLDPVAVRRALRGVDAVCHLAGLDYDAAASEQDYLLANVLGSWNVLEAAAKNGVSRVVVTSSVTAYGLLDSGFVHKPRYLPIDECHPCRPVDAYSVSKRIVEDLGEAWATKADMSVVTLRPMHVVMKETLQSFVQFVERVPAGWLFNYVAAEDVARGFRRALEIDGVTCDTFLLGATDTARPEPTLEWYARTVGALPRILDPRLYCEHPLASVFSLEKSREVLGWAPQVSFEDLRIAKELKR